MKYPFILISLTLAACSTALKYHEAQNSEVIESTALKFQLADSSVTLSPLGASSPAVGQAPSSCAAGISDAQWADCLSHVGVHAAIAPGNNDGKTAATKTYVATTDDAAHLWFSSTTISGVPISGTDDLYSQVTIKYKNNTSTIIAGASTGAVSGFGLGGPYGAAVGFLIGAATAVAHGPAIAPVTSKALTDFLCSSDLQNMDFSQIPTQHLPVSLYLPVTIAAQQGRPFPVRDDISSQSGDPSSTTCWHILGNTHYVGITSAHSLLNVSPAGTPRIPVEGDGWLFRIVAETKSPATGTVTTDSYFQDTGVRSDFPYSSCKKVAVQIVWWKELDDAITRRNAGKPFDPNIVEFNTVAADPDNVYVAKVEKGGAINFKPDCGANISLDADSSGIATVNAVVSASQDIYKAEQSWEASRHKK